MILHQPNYMDNFATPEAYIRAEVLANRGTRSVVTKEQLLAIASQSDDEVKQLEKLSKEQLFDKILDLYGNEAYAIFPVGVYSGNFQKKYDITHAQVKKLAKAGVIAVTGEYSFHAYGRENTAKTYSPYDYFRLTPTEVHSALAELESGRGSKQPNRHEEKEPV